MTDTERARLNKLWDAMADLVGAYAPEDVLDALSDAFLQFDVPGANIRRMERIGFALERVRAENATEVAP